VKVVRLLNVAAAETHTFERDVEDPVDSTAAMAGAAIGAILAVIIIVFFIVCVAYKR